MRAPSVTPMANARTPTNGLKMDVAACKIAVIEGALKTGSLVVHLLFNYTPLEQDGRDRTASARRPTARADHCALHVAYHANNEMSRATMYVTIASAAGQSTSDVSTIAAPRLASPAAPPR